jgi:ABC-type branched-subunit amino acid transport system substrate-binding protein
VARRYARLFGEPMPPAALYGYEAMRGVLAAIARAGADGNDRRAVLRRYLATSPRSSVLGAYAIGPLGDVSGMPLGIFGSGRGGLRLLRVLDGGQD